MAYKTRLVFHKAIQVTFLFFGRPPHFTQPLTRMKGSRLKLNAFQFLCRGNIQIIFDRLAVLHPVVQEARNFNQPLLGFRFHLILFVHSNRFGSFDRSAIVLYLALLASLCRLAAGFEKPDGP